MQTTVTMAAKMEKIGPITGNSVLLMQRVPALLGLYPGWLHSVTHRPTPLTISRRYGLTHSWQLGPPYVLHFLQFGMQATHFCVVRSAAVPSGHSTQHLDL